MFVPTHTSPRGAIGDDAAMRKSSDLLHRRLEGAFAVAKSMSLSRDNMSRMNPRALLINPVMRACLIKAARVGCVKSNLSYLDCISAKQIGV